MGFKHLRYEVSESNEVVTIAIEKKVSEELTFWVRTEDGSAQAGKDYKHMNELITLKANESSREI